MHESPFRSDVIGAHLLEARAERCTDLVSAVIGRGREAFNLLGASSVSVDQRVPA